jgi:hypothetical protein
MFKMSGGLTPVFRDADEFAAFAEPGYAKTLSENFSMNLEQRRISPRMGLPK